MDKIKIDVYNIVSSPYCVESEDGERIFQAIEKALGKGRDIVVSFKNVEIITTAFLNPAIGKLLECHTKEEVLAKMSFVDIIESDKLKINRVIETAELYYKDPDRMQRTVDSIYED